MQERNDKRQVVAPSIVPPSLSLAEMEGENGARKEGSLSGYSRAKGTGREDSDVSEGRGKRDIRRDGTSRQQEQKRRIGPTWLLMAFSSASPAIIAAEGAAALLSMEASISRAGRESMESIIPLNDIRRRLVARKAFNSIETARNLSSRKPSSSSAP